MTAPKPKSVEEAVHLLRPGLYRYDDAADLMAADGTLFHIKAGEDARVVLTQEELGRPDWLSIAKERLKWPT